jgi:hypothetical protein
MPRPLLIADPENATIEELIKEQLIKRSNHHIGVHGVRN